MNTILKLDELLTYYDGARINILLNLDITQILTLSECNKAINTVCQDEFIWNYLTTKEFPYNTKVLSNNTWKMNYIHLHQYNYIYEHSYHIKNKH